jgi:hypothetical protein
LNRELLLFISVKLWQIVKKREEKSLKNRGFRSSNLNDIAAAYLVLNNVLGVKAGITSESQDQSV